MELARSWVGKGVSTCFSGRKGIQRRLVSCLLNNLKKLGETKIKGHLLPPEPYSALSV